MRACVSRLIYGVWYAVNTGCLPSCAVVLYRAHMRINSTRCGAVRVHFLTLSLTDALKSPILC